MTTREDRLPNPAVDRDRAIAALIYCASKHPGKTLGEVIDFATQDLWAPLNASDADMTSAFRSYAKEPA